MSRSKLRLETNATSTLLQKLSSFNTHEMTSRRIGHTWPGGGFTSRWSRSKGSNKATACCADFATSGDNDYEAVDLADSHHAHNDQAGPYSDDGDYVQHEHDDVCDTSDSYIAVDTANAHEASELDAVALLADTCDVDLVSDPEVSEGGNKGKAKGKYLFAQHTYHWKTTVDD